eukprot:GHVS01045047.1.p1 GENE.GHVS01045047.1~~GHVS01045047.1.p1  ORF type:complete len:789 (-),score=195.51 GHVS01045047.1:701-2779(-)
MGQTRQEEQGETTYMFGEGESHSLLKVEDSTEEEEDEDNTQQKEQLRTDAKGRMVKKTAEPPFNSFGPSDNPSNKRRCVEIEAVKGGGGWLMQRCYRKVVCWLAGGGGGDNRKELKDVATLGNKRCRKSKNVVHSTDEAAELASVGIEEEGNRNKGIGDKGLKSPPTTRSTSSSLDLFGVSSYSGLVESSNEMRGGKILFATDESNGIAQNMISRRRPEVSRYEGGCWVDGWATGGGDAVMREQQWCLIELGVLCFVRAMEISVEGLSRDQIGKGFLVVEGGVLPGIAQMLRHSRRSSGGEEIGREVESLDKLVGRRGNVMSDEWVELAERCVTECKHNAGGCWTQLLVKETCDYEHDDRVCMQFAPSTTTASQQTDYSCGYDQLREPILTAGRLEKQRLRDTADLRSTQPSFNCTLQLSFPPCYSLAAKSLLFQQFRLRVAAGCGLSRFRVFGEVVGGRALSMAVHVPEVIDLAHWRMGGLPVCWAARGKGGQPLDMLGANEFGGWHTFVTTNNGSSNSSRVVQEEKLLAVEGLGDLLLLNNNNNGDNIGDMNDDDDMCWCIIKLAFRGVLHEIIVDFDYSSSSDQRTTTSTTSCCVPSYCNVDVLDDDALWEQDITDQATMFSSCSSGGGSGTSSWYPAVRNGNSGSRYGVGCLVGTHVRLCVPTATTVSRMKVWGRPVVSTTAAGDCVS